MLHKLEHWVVAWIHPNNDVRKSRTLIYGVMVTMLFMLYYSLIGWFIEFPNAIRICLVVALALSAIPFLLKRGISTHFLGNYYALVGLAGISLLTILTGGIDSPILPWIALVPLVALLFANKMSAMVWVVLSIIALIRIQWMTHEGMTDHVQYNPAYRTFLFANCYIGLVITLFFLNAIFEDSLEKANAKLTMQSKTIAEEKSKSDHLLLNVLPEDIAEELKSKGHCEARHYDQVSILFTDFVNFTKYSETITPANLISELHHYFQYFDQVIEKYKLEKIKTIGDAYMAVSGLPKSDPDHALNAVSAAIEMQTYIKQCIETPLLEESKDYKPARFQMKVGIHSGDVIAGVVGTKKFAFDIWGDTVNTAARILQSAPPNTINISRDTYNLVGNKIKCSFRGMIPLKSKGDMELYTVDIP